MVSETSETNRAQAEHPGFFSEVAVRMTALQQELVVLILPRQELCARLVHTLRDPALVIKMNPNHHKSGVVAAMCSWAPCQHDSAQLRNHWTLLQTCCGSFAFVRLERCIQRSFEFCYIRGCECRNAGLCSQCKRHSIHLRA